MGGCTEERFLKDVSDHQMTIIRDEGNHRHLRFQKPGTSAYRFELITWDGQLCITGDCGTYVFARLTDMFNFFRMDKGDFNHSEDKKLNINSGYWGEKLLSIGTNAGYEKYAPDVFKQTIKESFEGWEFESDEQKEEVWEQVENDVLSCADDGEVRAFDAANEYESDYDHEFTDFWESDLTEYTMRYVWCLYAIVYGIGAYDQSKAAEAA